jgi:hypothetical protein
MLDADQAYAEGGLTDAPACERMLKAFRNAREFLGSPGILGSGEGRG